VTPAVVRTTPAWTTSGGVIRVTPAR
jgi:hypothetical protein